MTNNVTPDVFKMHVWQLLKPLIHQLNDQQNIWLTNYLLSQRAVSKALREQPPEMPEIMLLHGGETGNSKRLALQFKKKIISNGYSAQVEDLSNVKLRQLIKYPTTIFICSTHGYGDPPSTISDFYESLMSHTERSFEGFQYAVLALGDRSYEYFCVAGIAIDEKIAMLGGNRLIDREDCDVNYQTQANQWIEKLIKKLPRKTDNIKRSEVVMLDEPLKEVSKSNPLATTLLEKINLSHPDRKDANHHLVLGLERSEMEFTEGDAVAVLVQNPEHLVNNIIDATSMTPSEMVNINNESVTLKHALTEKLDLTIPSRDFVQLWLSLDTNGNFQPAVGSSEKDIKDFIKTHQLLEIVKKFRSTPNAQQFVDVLRPLQPRLYDIANAARYVTDEIHICIKRYLYSLGNKINAGIGSNYLIDLPVGSVVNLYLHKHARFHLPEKNNVPLILIADGTGIAPYRAFIQAISTSVRSHDCWIIFSEKNFEQDFLYQTEWISALEKRTIKYLTPVFDEDLSICSHFHFLLEKEEILEKWIINGAHIYFSGDKKRLLNCENEFKEWFESQQFKSLKWSDLNKEKRIHRNMY